MYTFASRLALGVCALACSVTTARGQLDIDVEVTPLGGGNYGYAYSLTNNTALDIVIVSIEVPAVAGAIASLQAPSGFLANFDPGLGFLDFLENSLSFAPGLQITGFTFESPYAPGTAAYEALNINGEPFAGFTTAPVPEPTSGLLLAGMVLVTLRPRSRSDSCHVQCSGEPTHA